MNLAAEAMRRHPFGHCVGIEERAIYPLRRRAQHAMQSNRVAHGAHPGMATWSISPLTTQWHPNLSVTMPKPLAQNVGANGMPTLPLSANASNTRLACATES